MAGAFITFEGGEGSGKSTQIAMLEAAFAAAGSPCIKTREPGGTPSAERVRELLVTGDVDAWDPVSETLLFYAARCEHVTRLIKPALLAGTHVICDRFADSTAVYQGVGKGLSAAFIASLHQLALGDFRPDLTLILDIAPEQGLARAKGRAGHETRFEEMDIAFHQRIREGFLKIAEREADRCVVLSAAQDKDALHQQVLATIGKKLGIAI
jgi:dTMP kinase